MSDSVENAEKVNSDGKIRCQKCGERVHMISRHLEERHSDATDETSFMTLESYEKAYPEAPLESEMVTQRRKELMEKAEKEKKAKASAPVRESKTVPSSVGTSVVSTQEPFIKSTAALGELFGFGDAAEAKSSKGNPIPISVFSPPAMLDEYLPEIDTNHIFTIPLLKAVLIGLEMGINVFLYGHMGTGKSTTIENICAYTRRPWIRIQHSRDTEQSHIVGQWTVKDGETVFELGPLAYAMRHGLVYVADEYDFALPSVLAIYQPIMEGKALVIKEADLENRIIKPHPNFRFLATGNTNGSGDETGLYQGTVTQNAANFERFGIVEQVHYMPAAVEQRVIAAQAGVDANIAKDFVKFAGLIREAYGRGDVSIPISPRSLINSAKVGLRFGDLTRGIELSFLNRLDSTSEQTAREIMGRVFK